MFGIVEFLVAVLHKLEQALADVENPETPAPVGDGQQAMPPEIWIELMPSQVYWAGDRAPREQGGEDLFLFRHATAEERETHADMRHGDRAEDLTIYDRIVMFLMSGDSEAQLADTHMGFDLTAILADPAGAFALEI